MGINLANLLIIGASMAGVLIEEPTPSATEEQVAKFEKLIGYELPSDYKEFLLTVNGGAVNPNIAEYISVPVEPLISGSVAYSKSFGFNFLFSLFEGYDEILGGDMRTLTLAWNYKSFMEMEGEGFPFVPIDCIPIASYHGRGALLLGVNGVHKNKVLYYAYNRDPAQLYGNVSLVANSFTEFMGVLSMSE